MQFPLVHTPEDKRLKKAHSFFSLMKVLVATTLKCRNKQRPSRTASTAMPPMQNPLQHHHVTPEHKGSQGPHQCQRTVDTPTHFSSMQDTTDAAHPEAALDPLTLAQESVVEDRENQRELSMQSFH